MASLIDDAAEHSSASEGEEVEEPTSEDANFINDGELDFDFDHDEEEPRKRLTKGKAKPKAAEPTTAEPKTAEPKTAEPISDDEGVPECVNEGVPEGAAPVDKGKQREKRKARDEPLVEPEDPDDNASLFKKRKVEAKEKEDKKHKGEVKRASGGKYAGHMFAVQISDVNSFRQIVAILVQVQTRCSVDGVMFHITEDDSFAGLEFTLFLDSVLLTGRLKSLPLHIWEEGQASFYVNVADLATQLKHIKHDNVCVITKLVGSSQLVINSYAQGPDTSSLQQMKLNEPEMLDDHPGHFPSMKYEFDLVLAAPDMKTLVQQASEINAEAMEVSLFQASEECDIKSVFQFEASDQARCKSVQNRWVNFSEKSVDSEGVYHLDTLIKELLEGGQLLQKLKQCYTVETLKYITMSLKNEHQITLSFGAPSIVDGETGEVVSWEDYTANMDDSSSVDFIAESLFLSINLNEDSYIKMLVCARVEAP